jgi:hypothetical protein
MSAWQLLERVRALAEGTVLLTLDAQKTILHLAKENSVRGQSGSLCVASTEDASPLYRRGLSLHVAILQLWWENVTQKLFFSLAQQFASASPKLCLETLLLEAPLECSEPRSAESLQCVVWSQWLLSLRDDRFLQYGAVGPVAHLRTTFSSQIQPEDSTCHAKHWLWGSSTTSA